MATITFDQFVKQGTGNPSDIIGGMPRVPSPTTFTAPPKQSNVGLLNTPVGQEITKSWTQRGENIVGGAKELFGDINKPGQYQVPDVALKGLVTAGHVAGNVAGGVFDIFTHAASPLIPQPVKDAYSSAVEGTADKITDVPEIRNALNKYNAFADKNPDVHKSIGDVFNTLLLLASEAKPKSKQATTIQKDYRMNTDNTLKNYDNLIKAGDVTPDQVYTNPQAKIFQPAVADQVISDTVNNLTQRGYSDIATKFSQMVDRSNLTPQMVTQTVDKLIETANPSRVIPAKVGEVMKDSKTNISQAIQEGKSFVEDTMVPKAQSFLEGGKKYLQDKAVDSLEKDYSDWASGTKSGVQLVGDVESRTTAMNRAGTSGKTPQRILAEAKIIPETQGTKFRTRDQAQTYRQSLKPLQDAADLAIEEVAQATSPLPIDQLQAHSIANISKLKIPVGDKVALINEVRAEYQNLKSIYGDEIKINDLNKEKKNYWNGTFDNSRPFKTKAFYQMGKSAQRAIEDVSESAGFKDVAQLNREIGDRLNASEFLENLDGNTIKGGRLKKYVFMGLGATLGNGVPAKVAGALGGDLVAQILIDTSVSSPVKRLILNTMETTNPESFKATLDWLRQQGLDREMRPLLPAPSGGSTLNQGRPILGMPPRSTGEYVGGEMAVPAAQSLPASFNSTQAIPKANNVSIIPDSVQLNEKKSSIPPVGEVSTRFPTYIGDSQMTLKTLESLKGRTVASKQFISDLAKKSDLRQPERDLLNSVLKEYPEGQNIPVAEFAEKVRDQLLPLEVLDRETSGGGGSRNIGRYEHITLPDELKGDVQHYGERIYESPIKTSGGDVHFSGQKADNYFAHTRIEDMAPDGNIRGEFAAAPGTKGTTRRILEVQSDLFQKGRLEGEKDVSKTIEEMRDGESTFKRTPERDAEISKLEPYRNTWYERVLREEVKQAAKDGKTKLQIPTGETAMKIEGLGENASWYDVAKPQIRLMPDDLRVGKVINDHGSSDWIITEVGKDGKFKAVPNDHVHKKSANTKYLTGSEKYFPGGDKFYEPQYQETFDISGKIDTSNPIYNFYEKEIGSFLKKNFNAKLKTDKNGVKWYEINVDKSKASEPVQVFGKTKPVAMTASALDAFQSGNQSASSAPNEGDVQKPWEAPSDTVKEALPKFKTVEELQKYMKDNPGKKGELMLQQDSLGAPPPPGRNQSYVVNKQGKRYFVNYNLDDFDEGTVLGPNSTNNIEQYLRLAETYNNKVPSVEAGAFPVHMNPGQPLSSEFPSKDTNFPNVINNFAGNLGKKGKRKGIELPLTPQIIEKANRRVPEKDADGKPVRDKDGNIVYTNEYVDPEFKAFIDLVQSQESTAPQIQNIFQ